MAAKSWQQSGVYRRSQVLTLVSTLFVRTPQLQANKLHDSEYVLLSSLYLCHPGRLVFSLVSLWRLVQAAVWESRESPASGGPLTPKADVCAGSPLAWWAWGWGRPRTGGCSPSCWRGGRSTEFASRQGGPHSRPCASSWPPAPRRGSARMWSSPTKT